MRDLLNQLMQHVQSPEFDKNRSMKEVMNFLRERGSKKAYSQLGSVTDDRIDAFNRILGIEGPPAKTPVEETPVEETPVEETPVEQTPDNTGFYVPEKPPKEFEFKLPEESPPPPKAAAPVAKKS